MLLARSYNIDGKKLKDFELPAEVFGIVPNESVLHEVLVAELASFRQGSASTKTRSMVRGGGRKPYRQKGTGRARQGSIRSPQWVGGGTVFGPTPRDHSKKVNKKVRMLALKSALSSKASEGGVSVLNDIKMESRKTKDASKFISSVSPEGMNLFVISDFFENENFYYSFRNLKNTFIIGVEDLSVYLLLKSKNIHISKDVVEYLKGVLI